MTDTYLQAPVTPLGVGRSQWVTRFKGDVGNINTLLRERSVSVTRYGAVGDGITDDSAAILSAIADVQAAGGGGVFLGPGTHVCTQQILLPSSGNVHLYGVGQLSKLSFNLAGGGYAVLCPSGSQYHSIRNLSITTMAGTTNDHTLLVVLGSNDILIEDIYIDGGASGRTGLILRDSCRRVIVNGIDIRNVTCNPTTHSSGIGLWMFRDIKQCSLAQVLTDTTGSVGVMLDAGTSDQAGIEVTENILTNISVFNASQDAAELISGGISFEGAHRNVISGVVIDGVPHAPGMKFSTDQTIVSGQNAAADENAISNAYIANCGFSAIQLIGASRNTFVNVVMKNVYTAGPTAGSQSAISIDSASDLLGAGATSRVFNADANRFIHSRVLPQDSIYAANYQYFATYASSDPAGTGHVWGNRFLWCDQGAPTHSTFVVGLGHAGAGSDEATYAPVSGVNANWFDAFAIDGNLAGIGIGIGANRTARIYAQGDNLYYNIATGADHFFQYNGVSQLRVGNAYLIPATDAVATLGTSGNRWLDLWMSGVLHNAGTIQHTGTLVGFYGATPLVQQSVGAAAVDAATTQTLANNLRAALIALGLVKT